MGRGGRDCRCVYKRVLAWLLAELLLLLLLEVAVAGEWAVDNLVQLEVDAVASSTRRRGGANLAAQLALRARSARGNVFKVLEGADAELHGCRRRGGREGG
jgi:hypothetical protein